MALFLIVVQGLMVIGLIAVGVHYKGMAIGLFGAVGVLAPLGFKITDILTITVPASIAAIVVGAFIMNRRGKELEDDPEFQRRLAAGELVAPDPNPEGKAVTAAGKRSALIFLAGVAFIVCAGIFEELRPHVMSKGKSVEVDLSQLIQITMFTVAAMITALCNIKAGDIVKSPLFDSGMVAVVALFGVAWMANTFIAANEAAVVGGLGELAKQAPIMIAFALFAVAAITTSQSSATFSIIPIGIALGLSPAKLTAMWPAVVGVFFLPTNGAQIATVEMDGTGSTRIGAAVINHSFLLPVLVYSTVAVGVGLLLASLR